MTTTTTGGLIEFYTFVNSDPNKVVEMFHELIGQPVMMPKWALGWHQSRWGWSKTADMQAVLKGYQDNHIPLDGMWSDIDVMQDYRDFTFDSTNYADLATFVGTLHTAGMKYVPIVDPGVAMRPGLSGTPANPDDYKFYDDGVTDDVFLKGADGQPFVGKGWAGDVVYPDFTHAKAMDWWHKGISDFHT